VRTADAFETFRVPVSLEPNAEQPPSQPSNRASDDRSARPGAARPALILPRQAKRPPHQPLKKGRTLPIITIVTGLVVAALVVGGTSAMVGIVLEGR
jgi:hypothetical protein